MNVEDAIIKNLEYQKETGKLIWKTNRGVARKGMEAGYLRSDGRICVCIARKRIRAHRIVWFLNYGKWPEKEIDHIDGNPTNNRIENLRDVSVRENQSNQKIHRAGKLVGARWSNKNHLNPWMAQIRINGKKVHLGCFKTEKEAHEAYIEKRKAVV